MLSSNSPPENSWRADLQKNGYVVIKGAIPQDRAESYQQKSFDWLKSFQTPLDLSDPDTWIEENLPVQSEINTFSTYAVTHEKFMWDARQEPAILAAFKEIWGTGDLLVSFDALNVTFPNRKDWIPKGAWPHIDQSPFKEGMHCVQGIINLSSAGPEDGSLVVFPGSQLLAEEFFRTQVPKSSWRSKDYYAFTEEQMQWFSKRGMEAKKVLAEPGDLILWDSRTVHWGAEPSVKSQTIRTVIYVSYAPAAEASAESLKTKAHIFNTWGATTHWANRNIAWKETKTLLKDGTRDPRDRDEPLEKPEMTPQLLRLAGLSPY